MKAPDKIYIPYYPNYDGIDTHLSDEWFEGKAIDHVEGWIEYICKDVLLEWIKANLQDRDNWNEKSAAEAFCETIDKLNSM